MRAKKRGRPRKVTTGKKRGRPPKSASGAKRGRPRKVRGDDSQFEVLANGAKQSKVATRMDLLPPRAMLRLSEVLCEGAGKYGDNNWHGIPKESHLNHMQRHIFLFLKGDTSEDHLGHMLCRAAMLFERNAMDEEGI